MRVCFQVELDETRMNSRTSSLLRRSCAELTKQAQQVLRPVYIRRADVTLLRDGVIELVPLVAVQQHCWQGLVEVGSETVYNFNGGVVGPALGPEWEQVSGRSQLVPKPKSTFNRGQDKIGRSGGLGRGLYLLYLCLVLQTCSFLLSDNWNTFCNDAP